MILVDTSVWVEHLRAGDARLVALLNSGTVLTHPFVVGELALGSFADRGRIIHLLLNLPQVSLVTDDEALHFIESKALFGLGIGYVDAHLLAATTITPSAKLWTRDKRLQESADRLGLAAAP